MMLIFRGGIRSLMLLKDGLPLLALRQTLARPCCLIIFFYSRDAVTLDVFTFLAKRASFLAKCVAFLVKCVARLVSLVTLLLVFFKEAIQVLHAGSLSHIAPLVL